MQFENHAALACKAIPPEMRDNAIGNGTPRTKTSIEASPSKSRIYDSFALFAIILGIRLINALTLATFFQPDEYFQSLEPAWQIAFGEDSGAWITWVL